MHSMTGSVFLVFVGWFKTEISYKRETGRKILSGMQEKSHLYESHLYEKEKHLTFNFPHPTEDMLKS